VFHLLDVKGIKTVVPRCMQAAHLDLDEAVDIREESGRIVIEPAQHKEYDLAELVKQITGENLHDQADFGRPVGKEAL
jgi:antitoxin MazE